MKSAKNFFGERTQAKLKWLQNPR